MWQELAAAIDEEDVAKFTTIVKEFDSMTQLVHSSPPLKLWIHTVIFMLDFYQFVAICILGFSKFDRSL